MSELARRDFPSPVDPPAATGGITHDGRREARLAEALAAILAERVGQFANGHTLEADRAGSPRELQRIALKYLQYGIEDEQFARPLWRARAHRHYAVSAAALLALMLRLPDADEADPSKEEEHPSDAQ